MGDEFEFESDNDDWKTDLNSKPDACQEPAAPSTGQSLTAFRAETAARARSAGGQAVDSKFAAMATESKSSADAPQKKSRSEPDAVSKLSATATASAADQEQSRASAARAAGPRL